MSSRDQTEEKLERLVSQVLRDQPLRQAPASLEARVLGELATRARQPWWRRGVASWPVGGTCAGHRGLRRVRSTGMGSVALAGGAPGLRGSLSASRARSPCCRRPDTLSHRSARSRRTSFRASRKSGSRRNDRHRHTLRRALRAGSVRLLAALSQTRICQGSPDMNNFLPLAGEPAPCSHASAAAWFRRRRRTGNGWRRQNDRDIVSVGHNSELPAGEMPRT